MNKFAASSIETARTVAQDPSTEPFLLELIALHGDVELRQAVASNPNTPSKILFGLADEFPGEFLNNPVFPLLTLENPDFYKSLPNDTLRNLLANESVPDGWQQWASTQTNNWSLYESLVANPVTSHATLTKLVSKGGYIDELARMHVNYAGEMTSGWHEFFKDKFKPWKNQSYPDSREAVAMHPHAAEAFIPTKGKKAPLTVLDKLAKDTRQAVKIAVANNPKTSIETLEAIIRADKYHSKPSLAALKHLLLRAPDRAEKHLLHYYEQISDSELSNFILEHPAAPIDLLKKKLRLLSWIERYTITQNHKTSQSILKILAGDANCVVRAAAKEKLATPDERM